MAFVTLNAKSLRHNFNYLNTLFKKKNIQWSIVSKLLCGNREYLEELLKNPIQQICDSRISNLKAIKQIQPQIETIYIRPPAKRVIKSVIQYADISMNTEIETIKLLSAEAAKNQKTHKIIIMIELGELREGIMYESFVAFFDQVFKLPNIKVVGFGANLSCLYGVLPNHDKLSQLCLYEKVIEAKYNQTIEYVSGGSSVTIPLVFDGFLPKGVNHFRVGESLFLGTDVYNNNSLKNMKTDVFLLHSEIIELIEKPMIPSGEIGTNVEGHAMEFDHDLRGRTTYRAIIDVGLLDVDEPHITPLDSSLKIVGGSSDMFVIDLLDNPKNYKVGDLLEFRMDYMGVLRVLNSKYIEKRINRESIVFQISNILENQLVF